MNAAQYIYKLHHVTMSEYCTSVVEAMFALYSFFFFTLKFIGKNKKNNNHYTSSAQCCIMKKLFCDSMVSTPFQKEDPLSLHGL